jgi:long-chain acyl-CoA synthetase
MWNRLGAIFSKTLSADTALDWALRAHPRRAVFTTAGPMRLPYPFEREIAAADLVGFCDAFGSFVRGQYHVSRAERIAILLDSGPEYFVLGLAIMRMGCVAVPIHANLSDDVISRYIQAVSCTLIFVDDTNLRRLDGILPNRCRILDVHGIPRQSLLGSERASSAPRTPPRGRDDELLIVHTSGTTGVPKGVVHTNASLSSGIRGQLQVQPFSVRNVALTAAPFNHFISYLGLLSALVAGLPVILAGPQKPQAILRLIEKFKVNVVFAFPNVYQELLGAGLTSHDLSSVRIWISGADAMHEAHIRPFVSTGAFLRLFGVRLLNSVFVDSYGSSEIGFAACFRYVFAFTRLFDRCVGRTTFAGPQVQIRGGDGRPLGPGKIGHIYVKGPTVFKKYVPVGEAAPITSDGWFFTGDVGRKDRLGRYYLLDREEDVLRTRSGAHYSLVLEERALRFNGVMEACAVTRAEDHLWIFLEVSRPAEFDVDLFVRWMAPALRHMAAAPFVRVCSAGSLPRGVTGKIRKMELETVSPNQG